jgi:hypothetical protein
VQAVTATQISSFHFKDPQVILMYTKAKEQFNRTLFQVLSEVCQQTK